MDSTHGPWKASKDTDARGNYCWRIDSASRALMAVATWPTEEERDSSEAASTARLIASAPVLLDACRLALAWEEGEDCGPGIGSCEVVAVLRQAITAALTPQPQATPLPCR